MVESIEEMKIGNEFDSFVCVVVAANPTNTYNKNGFESKVQNITVQDRVGKTVSLVLWNAQTDEFQNGEVILIKNGFCKEYPQGSGTKQISSAKMGLVTRASLNDIASAFPASIDGFLERLKDLTKKGKKK